MSRPGMRSRRTRVYDCNYNIGESYYKPTLDRMDRKYSGRPEVEPRISSFADREPFSREPFTREPFSRDTFARDSTANASSMDDGFFDVRGNRTVRGRPLSTAVEEDEFEDEVAASLRRLRANKKQSRFNEDMDMESSFERQPRLSDKILDAVGVNADINSARRAYAENEERTEKRIQRRLNDEGANLTKWTSLSTDESAASMRAKASKARLNDLEDEMMEMNERQAAREQRLARLRALVADSDVADSSVKVSMKSEKKQVTF